MDKIINDTTTEKVLSLGGTHTERKKRSIAITIMFVILVAGGIGCVMFIPWKHPALAFITAAVVAAVVITIYVKLSYAESDNENKASVIHTGDTFSYHYEFDANGFTVSGDAQKTAKWSEISSVRNIGGAYQIKCSDANFTVKKNGFDKSSDNAFKALLKEKGINII